MPQEQQKSNTAESRIASVKEVLKRTAGASEKPAAPASLSLYQMTSAMLSLLDQDDVDGAAIEAAFGDIQAKDNRICHFIRDVESAIAAHKDEEKRISDRRKAMENKVKQLKSFIQESMERLEVDELTAGTFKLKVQNNPAALEITDEKEIPDAYKIIIPQRIEPDRDRIKADLKAGNEIPGARLTVGRSIRIR